MWKYEESNLLQKSRAVNCYLIVGGGLSVLASLIHVGCIIFGAPWYRFFGAGEQMALLAQQGSLQPTLITSFIALVLFVWALYAFVADGLLVTLKEMLPFQGFVLVAITSIYLLRGVAGFFLINNPMGRTVEFWVWSSLICLLVGLVHLFGLRQQWAAS